MPCAFVNVYGVFNRYMEQSTVSSLRSFKLSKPPSMATKNYYAVAKGCAVGIFSSWPDAKRSVDGYPGALFRGFGVFSEAEEWLKTIRGGKNNPRDILPPVDRTKCSPAIQKQRKQGTQNTVPAASLQREDDIPVDIYTDGSCMNRILRIGAYAIVNGRDFRVSQTIDDEIFHRLAALRYELGMNSPTAELLAVLFCLDELSRITVAIANRRKFAVVFYVDYAGIIEWTAGRWNTKNPYIRVLVNKIVGLIAQIGGNVSFVKVAAHTGNVGNTEADRLAGLWTNFNELPAIADAI